MQNAEVYEALLAKFVAVYHGVPRVVAYAPGRIEVLGNHTDYNEGHVLSAAIDCGTFFAVRKREGTECRLIAGDLMHEVRFDLKEIKPAATDTWQNYVKGTMAGLMQLAPAQHGFEAMFLGNIPLGSGLSSSAALEMCSGLALAELYGWQVSDLQLAKIGQRAEHEYAGCKCGLLDQITSLAGKAGALVQTDFRSLEYRSVPWDKNFCFMMCNTHSTHALVDGAYNRRRTACETAAQYFKQRLRNPVQALRDVSMAEWVLYRDGLDDEVARRAAHPIGESERVLQGAACLAAGDMQRFGTLMYDSHESSRRLFENSCEELDFVVDTACSLPQVYGARLSGGGFGGSVVLLLKPEDFEAVAAALQTAYKAQFATACEVKMIVPSAGANLVQRL